ncbi:MAG: hypothetical protein KAG98_06925 [Lentisphaeria bacterium]|nr:hypothetical protein [Lentisphaeria bacterium]
MKKVILVFLAVGSTLMARDLKTNDGKVYKEINIVGKRSNGLKIVHSKGTSFIKFAELSPDVQAEFGYDAQKSKTLEKQLVDQKKKKSKLVSKRKKDQLKATNARTKVTEDILKNGDLLYFVKKQLFNLNGTKQVFNLPKIGTVCPGNVNFMIYGQKIYRVKGNAITVDRKVKMLTDEVSKLEEKVKTFNSDIKGIQKKVGLNLNRISQVMSNSGSSTLNGGSNDSGTTIINDLSSTQKRFIRDLERDNREFDRDIRKLEADIVASNAMVDTLSAEKTDLNGKLKSFQNSQSKFKTNETVKAVSPIPETENASPLKVKLIKLKKLFKEGYISKEVYDLKSKELLDELL